MTACGSGVEPDNEFRPDDPLNTWRAYVVRVTEAGTVQWQASYGSPHANNAAELVLPTRDGGLRGVRRLRRARRRRGSQHRHLQARG